MQQVQQHEPAVGGRYRVIRPAESVEDIDGSLVTFTPVEFVAVILEKPDKVIVFDGVRKVIEPLRMPLGSHAVIAKRVRSRKRDRTRFINYHCSAIKRGLMSTSQINQNQ